ncbi:hypothetical protein BP6252_08779 [Coleophoma cylindrospora]|uniref:Carboxylic ester hydrolase n=1 Tax=Coleophoma cylindrospora TaxID=1849047 RepID=A0A3D8R6U2_9HELO|nr:hypothetical protein BP6252_08779 [Coleophoma cylindrospora]
MKLFNAVATVVAVVVSGCEAAPTYSSVSPASVSGSAPSALPTVDLGYALHKATVNATGSYYNFSNIAFAEPPLGNLRFKEPIPPQTRNRTVNDGQQTRICPQSNPAWELIEAQLLTGTNVSVLAAEEAASSSSLNLSSVPTPGPTENEDCLLLDVIVPEAIYSSAYGKASRLNSACVDCAGAPVLVWIYGGGYTSGSKGANNPAGLIATSQTRGSNGIVFVAINYRLGMFGWLGGPIFQEGGTANVGLYDQRLALRWVQSNIHLFGGDPKRVTVMGESAGGGSIEHQITAYGGSRGKAPFQQAILQSAAFQPHPYPSQLDMIFNSTLSYASLVANTSITTLSQLRALPSYALQIINKVVVGVSDYGVFTYGPCVDGVIVPALPGQLFLSGQYDKTLNLMVGHNSDEPTFFTSPFINNVTTFDEFISASIPGAPAAAVAYIENDLYPPIFDGSQPYTSEYGRAKRVIDDSSFSCNSRYLASAFSNRTWDYYFAIPPGYHGEDVSYTFFNGDTTTLDDGLAVQAPVAKRLQSYITMFTKYGDPNGNGTPFFPVYGANSSSLVLDITNAGTVQKDTVATAYCDWWQKGLYI